MARRPGMMAGGTVFLMLAVSWGWAGDGAVLDVGKFSTESVDRVLPDGWTPLTFKKIPRFTRYELILEDQMVVVKATSDASASGLTKNVQIDPKVFPVVRWRWKVEQLLQRSNVTRKDGDDYPARLYITFAYDPEKVGLGRVLKYKAGRLLFGDIPIAALNYIWETRAPVGTIIENAYTDFARMIVVESGPQKVGQWVEEERNLYEDYKQAFGEEPPMINGVAIMTDTDNTGERAVAYYGDIRFERKSR
ncbi:MAG: DUF3047 domain-containing protein [Nitrospira sp.]